MHIHVYIFFSENGPKRMSKLFDIFTLTKKNIHTFKSYNANRNPRRNHPYTHCFSVDCSRTTGSAIARLFLCR